MADSFHRYTFSKIWFTKGFGISPCCMDTLPVSVVATTSNICFRRRDDVLPSPFAMFKFRCLSYAPSQDLYIGDKVHILERQW